MTQLTKAQIRTILTKYFDLKFAGSFQSIKKFQEALERKLDLKVSLRKLTEILKNNAFYQTHVTRPKKYLVRKFSSRGCGLLAHADPCYLQLPTKEIFKFLTVCDSLSKMVYGHVLKEVNPKELKMAFTALFKSPHYMSYYPVLVVDLDKSLSTLARPFFSSRHMLLRQKRGPQKLGYLEPVIRVLKKKLIQNIRRNKRKYYSEKLLKTMLKEAVDSYNDTINSSHGHRPRQVHHPFFDPYLRKVQYGDEPLVPFDRWYVEEMGRQKKVNTARPPQSKGNIKQDPNKYRVGDRVYIEYEPNSVARSYFQRRRKVMKVVRVDTRSKPYIYQVADEQDRTARGYFYGAELSYFPQNLQIQKIIRRKRGANGKMFGFAKFKDYDR